VTLRLAEDHDRIARGVNDVVVRRLFAAGLDLQAALGLMGEHRATPRICHAVGELDQAIRDLRDAIFGWDRDVTDSRRPNR
jgi:two-component system, NarL family, sensor histidine kinase DevS